MDQGETDLIDEMEEDKLEAITLKIKNHVQSIPADEVEQFEEPDDSVNDGDADADAEVEADDDDDDHDNDDPSSPADHHFNHNGISENDTPEYGAASDLGAGSAIQDFSEPTDHDEEVDSAGHPPDDDEDMIEEDDAQQPSTEPDTEMSINASIHADTADNESAEHDTGNDSVSQEDEGDDEIGNDEQDERSQSNRDVCHDDPAIGESDENCQVNGTQHYGSAGLKQKVNNDEQNVHGGHPNKLHYESINSSINGAGPSGIGSPSGNNVNNNLNNNSAGPSSMLMDGAIPANATFHGSYHTSNVGRKPALGQSCSLRTLVADGILQAGREVLTIEYMGTKFIGDLRRDGTIVMRGPDGLPHVYATPSAWANHCCKLINPENKPGSAWSAIRFKGKRLDSFKLKWYRKQKKPAVVTPQSSDSHSMNHHFAGNGDLNPVHNFSSPFFGQNYMPYRQDLPADLRGFNAAHQAIPARGGSMFPRSVGAPLHRPSTSGQHQRMPLVQQKLHIHNPLSMPDGTGAGPVLSVGNNYVRDISQMRNNKKLIETMLLGQTEMDQDCYDVVQKSTTYSDFDIDAVPGENVITYEMLGTRSNNVSRNPNVLVKCVPFSAIDRIQPFNVTVSTNALLLVDFHSHLVSNEVVGYLAGTWEVSRHTLTIQQAFPCRTKPTDDAGAAAAIENEIRQELEKKKLQLVGWYHSHQGKYSNHPTLKDIQNQIDYEIRMRDHEEGYRPCVGLICSPHDTRTKGDMTPTFQMYWVMPPPEHLTTHYGRPMQMIFSVQRDLFLTQDLLLEMRLLANHYQDAPDAIDFNTKYKYDDTVTYLEKLSRSVNPKLPKDLQESEYPDEPEIWKAAVEHFWKFLTNLVVEPSGLPPDSAPDTAGESALPNALESLNQATEPEELTDEAVKEEAPIKEESNADEDEGALAIDESANDEMKTSDSINDEIGEEEEKGETQATAEISADPEQAISLASDKASS